VSLPSRRREYERRSIDGMTAMRARLNLTTHDEPTPGHVIAVGSWWCSLGGLFTLIEAACNHHARLKAGRVFQTARLDMVQVRPATDADVDRWQVLREQSAAGVR
jgi:hypothetical protein